jgi:hypothetical protein
MHRRASEKNGHAKCHDQLPRLVDGSKQVKRPAARPHSMSEKAGGNKNKFNERTWRPAVWPVSSPTVASDSDQPTDRGDARGRALFKPDGSTEVLDMTK